MSRCSVISPPEFADAMAEHVAGVAVVTMQRDGCPSGLLVTSLTAFSGEPPSVLFAVATNSRSHDAIVSGVRFGVHLLSSRQEHIATAMASKLDDKFASVDWSWDGDVPRCNGTLVYLRCRRGAVFSYADHSIVIGIVEDTARLAGLEPLIYRRRQLDWRVVAPSARRGRREGAVERPAHESLQQPA